MLVFFKVKQINNSLMLVQRHKFVQPNFTTPNKVTKPNQKPKLSEYTPTNN